MRTSLINSLLFTLMLFLIPLQLQAKDMVVKAPPESLGKYYPPESKEPKWIQQMHKMSGNLGGVFVNLREKDWDNLDKNADQFVESYKEASEMVPEWEEYFDLKAAKEFAAAAKTHDGEKIGKAVGAVGKTCGKCHADNSISVWTRFHWPSFHKIKITDPIEEKELDFGKYMGLLSGTFKGVTVNFKEGQYDRSQKALRAFKSRFMELKSTCSKCHTTDDVKLFYVGENVAQAFDGLQKELTAEKPNPGNFWKNVGILGKQGCKNCHLTHRSYAMIQERWEEK